MIRPKLCIGLLLKKSVVRLLLLIRNGYKENGAMERATKFKGTLHSQRTKNKEEDARKGHTKTR